MRNSICCWLVSCAALYAATGVRTDDSTAKSVLEKGIKAAGGAENIAKQKALTWKCKGTFHGFGVPIEYTAAFFVMPPKQMKVQINGETNGMKFTLVQVLNGDKRWMSAMGQASEMDENTLTDLQSDLYEGRVASLVALNDSAYTIVALGESKVGDKAVVGLKVSHKGRPDVGLFFDKESGLLLKSTRKAKDQNGQETNQESVYADYKDVDGVKRYTKRTITRDGKPYNEMQISEWKPADTLPDSTFAKPG